MNTVTLLGRVGKEPESRFSQSGMQIVTLSLATNKKVKGEDVTSWHRLVAFSKTAELIGKYVKKGDQLGVEGEISYGSYEKDGTKIYTTDIIVNRIHFVSSKKTEDRGNLPQGGEDPYNPQANSQGAPTSIGNEDPEDDIPF